MGLKLSRKLKLRIIIGIAAAMILYGVLDRFFKFNIDPKVVSNVSMILMILAFGMLFSRNDEEKKEQTHTNIDESQLEQTALENDMTKDQDKDSTNNDNSRNDLRS